MFSLLFFLELLLILPYIFVLFFSPVDVNVFSQREHNTHAHRH